MTRTLGLAISAALLSACSRAQPPGPPPAGRSLGEVMVDVGRRFELAGRAGAARRFELAGYEAGELGELFEDAVPHASLPKEGPTAAIPGLARAFGKAAPAELGKAAASQDAAGFASAFARAASLCNGCHAAAGKAFIVVPTVPGQAVPVIEAAGAATAPRAP